MAKPRGLPSPEQILEFLRTADAKTGKREIARAFGIKGADRVELKKLLRKMADDGQIASRRKRLSDATGMPPVTVLRITGTDPDGELVAEPAEWLDHGDSPPRVLIVGEGARRRPSGPVAGVGDSVLARVTSTGDKDWPYEARIIKLLKGATGAVVGIFTASPRGGGQIMSANRKDKTGFDVMRGDEGDARSGDLVRAEITRQRGRGYAEARVVERLGSADDQRNVSLIAIHQHGIPDEFPKEVIKASEDLAELKPPRGRTDMRSLPLVTIDPPDARDHDDAVWAAADDDPANPGGYKTVVAIADVAAYVRPGTALDREARLRGNSVYFPDRVVPMLPERLSTDLCSLRGNEDRPAFACFMTFDKHGRKTGHRFDRIWMRSSAKLAYAQAQAAIDGNPDDVTGPLLEPVLKPLWAAYKVLKAARDKREPLELDLPERKLILDDAGEIVSVVTPARLDAHKLIEEFMIQANVSAAETLETKGSPLLFRVHDAPAPEKVDALAEFLATLELSVPKGQVMKPQHFNRILDKVRGGPNEGVVSQTVLRTQAQAIYTPENRGHFGLNLRRYAHFTSPIRRYADLIVHRALISALKLGDDGLSQFDIDNLEETAGLLCLAERRAMVAERETTDRLIAHFLRGQVGADFSGRVTGMVKAGLFVTLEDSGADGFIPASTLGDDYYVHDEASQAMIGQRSGESWRMGDVVEVRLVEVTPIAGGLRFEMLSKGRKGKPPASLGRKVRQAPRGKGPRRKSAGKPAKRHS
ncbi:MAG: ribonuclease R [Anderseniella sp.]|jgi:ribonuclease R|nr:ribonuclease R [Anderseniella sp.]